MNLIRAAIGWTCTWGSTASHSRDWLAPAAVPLLNSTLVLLSLSLSSLSLTLSVSLFLTNRWRCRLFPNGSPGPGTKIECEVPSSKWPTKVVSTPGVELRGKNWSWLTPGDKKKMKIYHECRGSSRYTARYTLQHHTVSCTINEA